MKKYFKEIILLFATIMITFLAAVIFLIVVTTPRYTARRVINNEMETVDWIFGAPKPIRVFTYGEKPDGSYNYTLIDSLEGVYNTGKVYLDLPKVIR